jgi:hypothetical protein
MILRTRISESGHAYSIEADPHICFASTVTTFDFALKERYDDSTVENLTLADRPFFAKVTKNEDFMGESLVTPVIHANPQGHAGSGQSTASTNETNVVGKKFTATPGSYQSSVSIGDKVLKLSRGNPGAFLQNRLAETDGLFEQAADNLATYTWGNGGGALGACASIDTETVVLTDPTDAMNFEEGMVLVGSDNDGEDVTDALHSGSTYVTAVDRSAGRVTTEDISDISGFGTADFLFRQGDFYGDTGVVVIKGVQAFVAGTESPAALWGMTRTSDPQRLAGCRVPSADYSGKNIEERINILGSYMSGRFKAKGPWDGYLHPEDWQSLSTSLQSRGIRPLKDESTKFGFMAIETVIGGQSVKIYSDRFCPKGTFFLLRMKNWTMHSPGKLIQPLNEDGLTMMRKSSNDYEFRLVSYPILMCNAPGYQGRIALP